MAGMGRVPKPESQVRRPGRTLAKGTTILPANGRAGDPPAWPLARQNKREAQLWARIWTTPQATQWEQLGWHDSVARYVRLLALIERPKYPAIALIEVRQMEDRLGLSPLAMLRLRWAVQAEEAAEDSGQVIDIRQRLKAVE